jgi:DNA-directed RNA polymerase alpha subunit
MNRERLIAHIVNLREALDELVFDLGLQDEEVPDEPICDELEIMVRSANALRKDKVLTIDQLCALEPYEVLHIPEIGKKGLDSIRHALAKQFNRCLKGDGDWFAAWLTRKKED